MKSNIVAACAVVFAHLALSGLLSAHHGAFLFDTTTPIRVKGTVVRYVWANPHSVIVLEQTTGDGKQIRWALESSSPLALLERNGFSKDSFKPGDVIEACGFAPKRALRTETPVQYPANPRPSWLDGTDRVITARLLLTQDGPKEHWSHYGPLELCLK
jgi:hypothetical protein